MKRKFDCHIRQQKIDTFLVVITTVHFGNYEVIKQYLTKWIGNFLFLSALSSTLNPHIADTDTINYDTGYSDERLPELKPGQRKNMKIISSATWRLEQLALLTQNNRGFENTYDWGPNYHNPHLDYQASGMSHKILLFEITKLLWLTITFRSIYACVGHSIDGTTISKSYKIQMHEFCSKFW